MVKRMAHPEESVCAHTLTVVEVCEYVGLSESMLHELLEQGVLPTVNDLMMPLDASQLERLHAAARLHQDLGVNVAGVVLALELLDELESLRQALAILTRHVGN